MFPFSYVSIFLLLLPKTPWGLKLQSSSHTSSTTTIAEAVVGAIMSSPLYKPIVKQARSTMVKTANSVGIKWEKIAKGMMGANDWTAATHSVMRESEDVKVPGYYQARFHGYQEGNLCIEAAIEQEIAGKAVGARNFPQEGIEGEKMLRGSYDDQLKNLGAIIPSQSVLLDMGCGTGTSTRRLSKLFPQAKEVIGMDLSPQMIAVGRHLQEGVTDNEWVETIEKDEKIKLIRGDIVNTGLPDGSVSLVSICLVLHELPPQVSKQIFEECYRILQPGGCLALMEMDPEAPGYRKLRANPWLFSVLRSTEPYLDDYFNFAPSMPSTLFQMGFSSVKVSAATGRHLTLVATKNGIIDIRPGDDAREQSDSHVGTLEKDMTKAKA